MQLGQVKCYSCNKYGHFKKNCPEGRAAAKQYVRSLKPEELCWVADSIGELPESQFIIPEDEPLESPSEEQSFSEPEQ